MSTIRIPFALIFLFIFLLPPYSNAQQQDTLTYSILLGGNIKGFKKVWQHADGSKEEWYQYNDRGRGDSLRTIYREDAEGFPLYIRTTGKDYMKNIVSETFDWKDGKAQWKNKAENITVTPEGKKFYIPLSGGGGSMLKALKAANGKLQLFPFGEVTMEVLDQHTIGTGAAARKLQLCRISGLSYVPGYYWMDEQQQTFAYTGDWYAFIEKGYEPFIKELSVIHHRKQRGYFHQLAKTIPVRATGDLLIRNISLFDSEKARLLPNTDVWVKDGVIKNISIGKRLQVPGAKVIDGNGKTMLPGLWDMHVHFADDLHGIVHLAAGVTHVRDMGNDSNLLKRIAQVKNKELIGPRVEVISGFIDGAGPYAAPTGALISSLEEGQEHIRKYAAKGYQQIKLYSSIKPEWVKPLVATAKQHHMRVCGHIPAYMTASRAIDAGYNEVTHMNMLVLNFLGDTVDTRTPMRFSLPARYAAGLDLTGAPMQAFIRQMKTHHTAVDPTLGVFASLLLAREGQPEGRYEGLTDHLPAQIQREIKAGGGGLPVPEGMDSTYRRSFETFLQITRMLYDNQITIVAGTDDVPGFAMHYELELYVRAGIPVEKVLQLATYGSAVYTGKDKEWGSIKVGRKADFFLVNGNPLERIQDLRKASFIMSDGSAYKAAKLYEAVSVKPFDR